MSRPRRRTSDQHTRMRVSKQPVAQQCTANTNLHATVAMRRTGVRAAVTRLQHRRLRGPPHSSAHAHLSRLLLRPAPRRAEAR